MLKESTMKMMKKDAQKDWINAKKKGRRAEVVNVPVLIIRNEDGSVSCVTSYTGHIIPEENKDR